jgi:DNA-binding response OmpR family regulator
VHVLVADDDPAFREVLADLLQDEGLRVSTAGTGDEVLCAVSGDSPDLVLLDARMPRLEPTAFARAWRAAAGCRSVPVVVISGLTDVPDPLCGLSAVAPMRKPFDLDELLEVVAHYCPTAWPRPEPALMTEPR